MDRQTETERETDKQTEMETEREGIMTERGGEGGRDRPVALSCSRHWGYEFPNQQSLFRCNEQSQMFQCLEHWFIAQAQDRSTGKTQKH